jgi:hypothetical protein
MGGPSAIEGDETPRVDSATKYVLRDKVSFIPDDALLVVCGVFALADVSEPLVVGIVAVSTVLEPFVDEHVGRIVRQCGLDELRHGEAWG